MRTSALRFALGFGLLCFAAHAQFTIEGVADKGVYPNTAQLRIPVQAGYSYTATLNNSNIPAGVFLTLTPDFYELRATRTDSNSGDVTNRYLRFIVEATERGGSELGLPRHTPFPVIYSSPAEFVGSRLRLLVPTNFPSGFDIPVVSWVVNEQDQAVRVNGQLSAPGQNSILVKRGVGSGFLSSNQSPGAVEYMPSVGGIGTNKTIHIEPATSWSNVSGVLNGTTTWAENARIRVTGHLSIPAGSTLNIGAGAIVLLNAGVNITNNGAVNITGTLDQPVVFMPNTRAQPWGGFFMRNSSGSLAATGTIFVGSGADPNGGAGHRSEQCLFLVDNDPSVSLVDSAAIHLAGQLGHAYRGGRFTFNRFLLQRATTGGEYTGSQFNVNDSAFIDFPDETPNYVDGDNDGLYLIGGVHTFTNTLFGWTKDDGVDSGGTDNASSGFARITYQSCWFESTIHEGNSLSGFKNVHTRHTVYIDCGQGIEGGYDAPTSRVDTCFFTMNKSGIRHGDNYQTFSRYDGVMVATNNIAIYNHRDLFGFNWDNSNNGGWTNNYERFFPSNNLVSMLDTNYPNNALWNPATDAYRLAPFGAPGRVGVGFGVRPGTLSLASFADTGIPVGLSLFCTNEVRVDYVINGTDGTQGSGTLVFPPGLTRHYIPAPTNANGVLRIALVNAINADVTGSGALLFQGGSSSNPGATVLVPFGSAWRYRDDGSDLGTAWRAVDYDDTAWTSGPSRLGFGADALPVATTLRRFVQTNGVNTARQVTNYYFRHAVVVTNLSACATMEFRYQRDDGCVVYVNGQQAFANNMGQPPYTANTFAATTISGAGPLMTIWTNAVPSSLFLPGTNVIAVEVHQSTATSSDIAWHMELVGLPTPPLPRVNFARLGTDAVLYWNEAGFALEEADVVTGPWRVVTSNSPAATAVQSNRFFRLRR
jgi:hypothetical protein